MSVNIAITVRPPYSWVISEAAALRAIDITRKRVENRGKPIHPRHIGDLVAIHSGATWSPEGGADMRVRNAWWAWSYAIETTRPELVALGDERVGTNPGQLGPDNPLIVRGAVVAVATIAGCHPATNLGGGRSCCEPWGQPTYNDGPCWHIELAYVTRLARPVPARGRLSVPWSLPADVAAAVTAAQQPAEVTR